MRVQFAQDLGHGIFYQLAHVDGIDILVIDNPQQTGQLVGIQADGTCSSLVLEQQSDTDYLLRVRCSKGTYVRTLCHDIGQVLGCGGCMSSLRRTMAAGFTLDDAASVSSAA